MGHPSRKQLFVAALVLGAFCTTAEAMAVWRFRPHKRKAPPAHSTPAPAESAGPAGPARSELLFHEGFESGFSSGWTSFAFHGGKGSPENSRSLQIVTSPVRQGKNALKVTVGPEDWVATGDKRQDKERAELCRQNTCRNGTCRFGNEAREGTELWYAWSILIPEDYTYNRTGHDWQIMGQWHDQPAQGERPTGYSPPISVHYRVSGGRPVFVLVYGLRQTGGPITEVETPIERGKWIDMVFHIRFSRGKDGYLETWKDGVPVKTPHGDDRITGPNMYNGEPDYLRIGLYRGEHQTQTNTLYYDEIRIATTKEALNQGS